VTVIAVPGMFHDIAATGFNVKHLVVSRDGADPDICSYTPEFLRDLFQQSLLLRYECFVADKRNQWVLPSAPRNVAAAIGCCPDVKAASYVDFLKRVIPKSKGTTKSKGVHFLEGLSNSVIEKMDLDQYDIPADKWREYAGESTIPEEMLYSYPGISKWNCDLFHVICLDLKLLKQGIGKVVAYQRAHVPHTFDALFAAHLDPINTAPEDKIPRNIHVGDIVEWTRVCRSKDTGFYAIVSGLVGVFSLMIHVRRNRLLGTSSRYLCMKLLVIFDDKMIYTNTDPVGKHQYMNVLNTSLEFNSWVLKLRAETLTKLSFIFRLSRNKLNIIEILIMILKFGSLRLMEILAKFRSQPYDKNMHRTRDTYKRSRSLSMPTHTPIMSASIKQGRIITSSS